MKILNIGSLNLDYVYHVKNFAKPGETISALSTFTSVGGKGLNQSIALAKAGANVLHLGCIGADGRELVTYLEKNGVDISLIEQVDAPNGQAIIQVDEQGQNCILVYAGSNDCISTTQIDKAISALNVDDIVLLQNEAANLEYALSKAKEHKNFIVLNPSPVNGTLSRIDLSMVNLFVVNEVEAMYLADQKTDDLNLLINGLKRKYPYADFLITLGKCGSAYVSKTVYVQKAFDVQTVDTTGAGDTFCGYFLAGLASRKNIKESLKMASAASALTVTRRGSSLSIPNINEVVNFIKNKENYYEKAR